MPRRIVEQIVDSAPVVPFLHAPEPQLVDSVVEVRKILDNLLTLFIRVYRIKYRRLLRAQLWNPLLELLFLRARELYCRLAPRGPRPGQTRIRRRHATDQSKIFVSVCMQKKGLSTRLGNDYRFQQVGLAISYTVHRD